MKLVRVGRFWDSATFSRKLRFALTTHNKSPLRGVSIHSSGALTHSFLKAITCPAVMPFATSVVFKIE